MTIQNSESKLLYVISAILISILIVVIVTITDRIMSAPPKKNVIVNAQLSYRERLPKRGIYFVIMVIFLFMLLGTYFLNTFV